MTSKPPAIDRHARPRWPWPWLLLVLALAWSALVRIPLILNAAAHLDSDLAVDGLTLLEATRGHWRWHYPGTPYMGTLPVLLSWPQAMIGGANPVTLVSGGTISYLGLVLAVFLLAWRTYGPVAVVGSLVPLTFASTGVLWLSGRVTGGHLLTVAWHAGAFALLHVCFAPRYGCSSVVPATPHPHPPPQGGREPIPPSPLVGEGGGGGKFCGKTPIVALGLWCGLGLYLDSMFLVTLAGILPAAIGGWWFSGRSWRAAARGLLFVPAFLVGFLPREAGKRLEPHDAYREQFEVVTGRDLLAEHARLLGLECLPRLITGHRLPGWQADPDPASLSGAAPLSTKPNADPMAVMVTVVGIAFFGVAAGALIRACLAPRDTAEGVVTAGLLLSAAVVAVGFVTNRNIFNSDNYRYLVTLLVPWCLGFGLVLRGLARRGRGGQLAALLCGLTMAGLMTADTARWYARFGWIDPRGLPVRNVRDDPALTWLDEHREVLAISGGYWDVYRLAFLTGGRVRGVPFPEYPDRFPEWSRTWQGGHAPILIARPDRLGRQYADRALRSGGRFLKRSRGFSIISWP